MTETSSFSEEPDWDAAPPVGTPERALWLAHWHFAFENPHQLDMLEKLYHDDIVWEVPGRRQIYHGKRDVLENYLRIFESSVDSKRTTIEQYATKDRAFDDSEFTFKLVDSKGFPNHPLPVGTRVDLRVVHNFHIQDGLIIRENGYEMWRPDISW
ncbi:nuclear transport factor 2 family protein [Amycolatopsis jejuensis]|uniref:nuclear transport factor 2 family protein n=1 Tax=Amycolatopsis jejuensis TaxID=330084 RepID=UPI00138DE29B|nr:nuclear transport factor 2 family protein [Amycolatopsis jejuensis]